VRAARHLHWAKYNESLADTFELTDSFNVDWCITVLFYAAVHYVDGYLDARSKRVQLHDERERAIADDVILLQIYHDYRALRRMSREARYEMAEYSRRDAEKAKRMLANIKAIILPRMTI
jgi:hypothetical protein